MEQKIVCTFMFSEPHEQELLWLKLNVEASYVDEWVITEAEYTFQGKHKPMYLKGILEQERFKPFLPKIHLIQLNHNYNFDYEIGFKELLKRKVKRYLNRKRKVKYDLVPYAENAAFYAEIIQRQACVNYLRERYSTDDIILPCDADEIIDLNEGKSDVLKNLLRQNETPFYIRRMIFCYDFDNLTPRQRYSPVVKLKDLTGSTQSMHLLRHPPITKRNIVYTSGCLAYEYTFCFSREAILKKLQSFAHVTDTDEKILQFALDNNLVMINPDKIDGNFLKDPETFYEKIELIPDTAPRFLRENWKSFRTGIVSSDYKRNRKTNHLEVIEKTEDEASPLH